MAGAAAPVSAEYEHYDWQRFAGYDLIGDVHGCADKLEALLERLGYALHDGVYEYADRSRPRQVIFLGDVVDRGPRIREALMRVRDMCTRGSARMVMGNHEYYLLSHFTPAGPALGRPFLRNHDAAHLRVLQETLDQFAHYRHDLPDFLGWLLELPLFLESPWFRVAHACWDQEMIERFRQQYQRDTLSPELLQLSADWTSFPSWVVDRLTRGRTVQLPPGHLIHGADGISRRSFRIKFWCGHARTFGDLAFQPDPLPAEVAGMPLEEHQMPHETCYGTHLPPLFVGHYWLRGEPAPLGPNLACLDYSAVSGGRLVAYRMDRESVLDPAKFVWV